MHHIRLLASAAKESLSVKQDASRGTRSISLLDALEGILVLLGEPQRSHIADQLSESSCQLLAFAAEPARSSADRMLLGLLALRTWTAASAGDHESIALASRTVGECARRLRIRGRLQ